VANINKPYGLRIHGPLLGCKMYKMSAAYAQALYIGDPMVLNSSGNAIIATAGTGNYILGAALGFFTSEFVPLTYSYHPSATAGTNYVLVADEPRQLFDMQEDSDTANLALTDLAGNMNIIDTDGGSTMSGLSGWELNSSDTAGSTAGDQVRLIDIYRSPDNAVGTNCRWVIRINKHQGLQGIVGVGI
jgi:hypothetical protein